MKNILKGLVIVVVIVCFASCDDYKPTAKKYFQYEKNNDTCIITGLSEAGEALEALELVIPKKIEGKPVTIISNAFAKADNIVSVTIPNTIKEFSHAFSKCKNLEIVTFEDGISIIDDYAFSDCKSIYEIELPDSVKSIGEGAFKNCIGLNYVTLSKKLQSLGAYAFYGCESLSSITIPETVDKIKRMAFRFSGIETIFLDGDRDSEPLEFGEGQGIISGLPKTQLDAFILEVEAAFDVFCVFYKFPNPYAIGSLKRIPTGPKVTIYGTRPIKTRCYRCNEMTNCELNYLVNSSLPQPSAFHAFLCEDCLAQIQ